MDDQEESRNVEDERDAGGFQLRPAHGIGLGTLAVALIGGWLLGISPLRMLGLLSGAGDSTPTPGIQGTAPPAGDPQARFVSQILRSTEVVWADAFERMGRQYQNPRLVLYRNSVGTACGLGRAAAGPFYCPNDRRVYLDLSFFDLMTQQLGAPGQFAHAYVIAHEVGHHVQNLLGMVGRGDADRGADGQSVRLELQADCYAGVWANLSQHEHGWRLEAGDIETALNAASRIGDDTLQRHSTGVVVPDSFTHGTSAQRVSWFKRGFESGSIERCDTFGAARL
ncbi:MAG TPA: neutral zinc metallopeptidase [Steroidobacteraceae bacterium]|nr:neutral zinc metallopeptidase [Steroidobacteraceae bacterium]